MRTRLAPGPAWISTRRNAPFRRPVAGQVRQPLYQTSIGRWSNYLPHTGALVQLLEASGFTYTKNTAERQTTASYRPLKRHDPKVGHASEISRPPHFHRRRAAFRQHLAL